MKKMTCISQGGDNVRNKGYETFQSRLSTLNGIMEVLGDPDVHMVGMYGPAAVGKTMLAKEVGRLAEEANLFSEVVFVSASRPENLEKLQRKLDGSSRFLQPLGREKKILIVLDDLCERLDLEDIGLASLRDDKREYKLILISRLQEVICNDMGSDKCFLVDALPDNEAMNFFTKTMGGSINNSDLQPLATQIVKECAGLPIAITMIAKSLRSTTSFSTWSITLEELKRSQSNIRGMHDKVFASIKLAYNLLDNGEAKSLLLLCSLYKADAEISVEHLSRYGVGMNLFQGLTTIEAARNKVLALVQILKNFGLLLDGDSDDTVQIHDIVRNFVISVASRDKRMYSMINVVELEEQLQKKELKDAIAISLNTSEEKIPFLNEDHASKNVTQKLDSQQLDVFFIFGKYKTWQLSDHLFEETKVLRVLHLIALDLRRLPSSLCFLQNLQTLCLSNCCLKDIALIGELKNLEILDLSNSLIVELPKEIGQLSCLQLLDLKYCSGLAVIRPNVISRLTQLEELDMECSFRSWNAEGLVNQVENANLEELKDLSALTVLCLHIQDARILPKDLFNGNLERYRISIGPDVLRFLNHPSSSRILKLSNVDKDTFVDQDGLQLLLKRTEDLSLSGLQGFNTVVGELDEMEGFPHLKNFEFKNSVGVRCIVNSTKQNHLCNAFASLESLYLQTLSDLETICCYEKLTAESFGRLKVIRVHNCQILENLFSLTVAKKLSQLERIEVTNCKMIEGAVVATGREKNVSDVNDDEVIELPQLRTLCLKYLPKMMQFLSDSRTRCTFSRSIQEILIQDSFSSLFSSKVSLPSLEDLELSHLTSIKFIWYCQQLTFRSFCHLKRLVVQHCKFLLKVIPLKVLRSLECLEKLEVGYCDLLEEVFYVDGLDNYVNEEIDVSLRKLSLTCLPSLRYIWKHDHQAAALHFKKLNCLRVDNCDALQYIFSPSMATCLVELERIEIKKCKMLEQVVTDGDEELPAINEIMFPSLKEIVITDCPDLFTFNFLFAFFSEKVSFPNLEVLKLCKLAELTYLWYERFGAPLGSFCKLRKIVVQDCPLLSKTIPFPVLFCLKSLEKFKLERCRLVEEVFDFGKLKAAGDIESDEMLVPLRELSLEDLPMLKCIWKNVPQGISFYNFKHLKQLNIVKCRSLKHIFSTSMASCLLGLEAISIRDCKKLEQVVVSSVGSEDEGGSALSHEKMMFPQLNSLRLSNLCGLQSFYSEQQKIEGLAETTNCPFSTTSSYPLFSKKVSLSNLESLDISGLPCKTIWHDSLPLFKCFCSLRKLKVGYCSVLVKAIPFKVLRFLESLEDLMFDSCGSLEEIFISEGPNFNEDYDNTPFFPLQSLVLLRLRSLKSIWKNAPRGSFYFRQLKQLNISSCNSLKSLLSPSMAICLVELETIKITWCDELKEVVSNEEEIPELADNAAVMFPQLHSVSLCHLKNFKSFYLGSHVISPSLKELEIEWSPNVNTFSSAKSICKSKAVKGDEVESKSTTGGVLFGEVNQNHPEELAQLRTLKLCQAQQLEHLLKEDYCNNVVSGAGGRPVFRSLEVVALSNCHGLKSLLFPCCLVLQNLTTLSLWRCLKLTSLFGTSTAKGLVQLRSMTIGFCDMMANVIVADNGDSRNDIDCHDEQNMNVKIAFPRLESLELVSLPSLTSFCAGNESPNFDFPHLTRAVVANCPALKFFCSGDVSTPKLGMVEMIYDSRAARDGYEGTIATKKVWMGDLNATVKDITRQLNVGEKQASKDEQDADEFEDDDDYFDDDFDDEDD